jgi:hypothetical protein
MKVESVCEAVVVISDTTVVEAMSVFEVAGLISDAFDVDLVGEVSSTADNYGVVVVEGVGEDAGEVDGA